MKRGSIAPESKSGRPGMIFRRNTSALSIARRALTPFALMTAFVVLSQVLLVACSGTGARANAQSPSAAQDSVKTATSDTSSPLSYPVKRGDSTLLLSRRYLSQSSLMTVAELETAIRDANGLKKGNALKPGSEIAIPTL